MNQQISYKYAKIELEQFAMFEENLLPEMSEVQFQTEVQFSFDKKNLVLCSKIVVTASQVEKPVMKADLRSFFEITSESIKMLRQEKKIMFPPQLLVQFASLCYGSMRGVIHVKTMGSPLNVFILPPIYFGNLIDKGFACRF